MNYVLLDVPTIPDWISATAALVGVIFGGVTLWKLLIRDEDKQQQINALRMIAEAQIAINTNLEAQIVQLIRQTIEFQEQTNIMAESVGIERDRLLTEKEKEIALKRPEFVPYRPQAGEKALNLFEMGFRNIGNTARNLFVGNLTGSRTGLHPLKQNLIVKKDEVLIVTFGMLDTSPLYGDADYSFDLTYSDLDGNFYKQIFKKEGFGSNLSFPEKYSLDS